MVNTYAGRRRTCSGLCFCLLAAAAGAIAEAPAAAESDSTAITAAELLELVRQSNPSVRAAEIAAEVHGLEIAPRAALADPQLTFSLENYPADSLDPNKFAMTGNTIGVSQVLPFPGKIAAINAASAAEHNSALLDTAKQRAEMLKQAALLYLEVHFTEGQLKLNADEAGLLRGMLATADNRLSVGTAPLTEVVTVRLESSALSIRRIELESRLSALRARIDGLLLQSLPVGWRTSGFQPARIEGRFATEEAALNAALNFDPELKTYTSGLQAAEKSAAVADFGYYPEIEVMAGYTVRQSNTDDDGTDFVSAGIGVNLPIWRSDKQDKIRQQALRTQELFRSRAAARRSQLGGEVRALYATISAADFAASIIRKSNLPEIDAAYSSARTSYETGQGDLPALFQILRSKFDQSNKLLSIAAEREKAVIELRYITGELS